MSNFIDAVIGFLNAVIDSISTYVHSDTAFVIDTQLAEMLKYCSDEAVRLIREVLDIYGR